MLVKKCHLIILFAVVLAINGADDSEEIDSDNNGPYEVEIPEDCCTEGEDWAETDCTPPPDPDRSKECLDSGQECCRKLLQERVECRNGIQMAKDTNNCDEADKAKAIVCCEECKIGILVGESNGCGKSKNGTFDECCQFASTKEKATISEDKEEDVTVPIPEVTSPETKDDRDGCELEGDALCAHKCVPAGKKYKCQCRPGFKLINDNHSCQKLDFNRCQSKNPCQQKCTDTGDAIVCSCRRGYELMVDNVSCIDIDECELQIHDCRTGYTCHNTPGSHRCTPPPGAASDPKPLSRSSNSACPKGFLFDKRSQVCNDIDECLTNPCPNSLVCANTIGSFNCGGAPAPPVPLPPRPAQAHRAPLDRRVPTVEAPPIPDVCPGGFQINQELRDCTDIDECKEGTDDCNRQSQFCLNTHGSFTCMDKASKTSCPPGFKKRPDFGCEDIDECAENHDICTPGSICVNDPGGYDCKPQPVGGYRPPVATPQVQEPSPAQPNPSKPTHSPKQSASRSSTPCPTGYRKSQNGGCDDINECRERTHSCDEHQTCHNTMGSHRCVCKPGFTKDPFTSACVDVNECQKDSLNDCMQNQRCDNTIGSYHCVRYISCGTGYTLNALSSTCEDDDECILGTDDCAQMGPFECLNMPGTYRCIRKKVITTPTPTIEYDSDEYYTDEEMEDMKAKENANNAVTPKSAEPSDNNIVQPSSTEASSPEPEEETPTTPPTANQDPKNRYPELKPRQPQPDPGYSQPRNPDPRYNQPSYAGPRQSQPDSRYNQPARPDPRNQQGNQDSRNNQPSNPDPRYSQPANPDPRYNQPANPDPRYNQPSNLEPRYNQPANPDPRYNQPANPDPRYNQPANPDPRYNQPANPDPRYNRPANPDPRYNQPANPDPRYQDPRYNPVGREDPRRIPIDRQPEQRQPEFKKEEELPKPQLYYPNPSRPRRPVVEHRPSEPRMEAAVAPSQSVTLVGNPDNDGNIVVDTKDVKENTWTNLVPGEKHCVSGFVMNGRNECVDLDECKTGKHICAPNSEICRNTPGAYTCLCAPGFLKELKTGLCKSRNELFPPIPMVPKWSPAPSVCDSGFQVNPLTRQCVDIDECAESDRCSVNEECSNTIGGFRCQCAPGFQQVADRCIKPIVIQPAIQQRPPVRVVSVTSAPRYNFCSWGYTMDKVQNRCVDVDECATDKHSCQENQKCVNIPGGYLCHCSPGHRITPEGGCIDIDECKDSQGKVCTHYATCVNTIGSFRCDCHPGFTTSPVSKQLCNDVDECLPNGGLGNCHQKCVNVWGSYRCACDSGFRLASDNRTCIDNNECTEHNVRLCMGECQNIPGSYQCTCPRGYRMGTDKRSCIDIDECETSELNCNEDEVCQNTRGGARCSSIACPPGYNRDPGTKHRCRRPPGTCRVNDYACLHQPDTYSFNFITFVSKLYIPTGPRSQVDLFTMRGPNWEQTMLRFQLRLVDARAPQGVELATIECFKLTPSPQQALVSLVKPLLGPQDIHLELSMELYHSGNFEGTAIAKIFIFVSEFEF